MALSSMTGFARRDGALGAWSWSVEARSVNGRNLEARFKGPPGLDGLERAVREAAQARFQRGQLNVALQAKRATAAGAVRINLDLVERYLEAFEPFVSAGRAARPTIDGLFALSGVIQTTDETDDPASRAELEAAMAETLALALDELRTARLEEGAALGRVLAGLIERIEGLVAEAEAVARDQPEAIKARLARRIAELLNEREGLDDRIVQEAAMMASRADVREELDRLASHTEAARALLSGDGQAGRRLDFLTQEFMREANTLCSKSASTALTATGLALKAAIDQFREQVQNVE